jgi:predicted aspartyl protease
MNVPIDFANLIGLGGSALMVLAFIYSNVAKVMNFLFFNLLNLVGSIMLIASLTVHFNLASMALEVVWAVIAIFGLAKAWIGRKTA